MTSVKLDVYGSSFEMNRLMNEEKISFKAYKYACYYGVTRRHVCGVNWDVCIWLTSFPSELQEVREFRNDCTFCTYSMDVITVEGSGRMKAHIRKTGRESFFSLEGKDLSDVLVLLSEFEDKTKEKQMKALHSETTLKQSVNKETIDENSVTTLEKCTNDKSLDKNEITPLQQSTNNETIDEHRVSNLISTEPKHLEKDPNLTSEPNTSESGVSRGVFERRKAIKPTSYRMTSNPRGICMIISNEDFYNLNDPSRLEKRLGAKQDVHKLSQMFTRLQFQVVLFKNLRDNEVVMTAKHMSLNDHSEYDSFVCCILSHGTHGSVYGVNHVAVPISEVLSQFRSRACHTLAGKPKLFFIQACQGLEPQIGVAVTDTPSMPQPAKLAADGTDFLVAYSTEPGYVAFRHRESGSYFIDALVSNLEGLPGYSLHDVMAKVCNDVSQLNINNGFKQVPQFTSTLTKQLVVCVESFEAESVHAGDEQEQNEEITSPAPTCSSNDVCSDKHTATKKHTKSPVCVIS